MSFDWNIIGKKVSLLYDKMEYQSDFDTEQFINDLETELRKKVWTPIKLLELKGSSHWVQLLKNAIDKRRSTLTKLFSLTNNSNGVDMLIEYCDYYQSYYFDSQQNNKAEYQLLHIIYKTFMTMATNGITDRVLPDLWVTFVKNIGWYPSELDMLSALDFTGRISFRSVAMVIMADSDLNAAMQAFIGSHNTSYRVSKVLVQEPIREELLNTIRNEELKDKILSNLFVFRNTEEALGNLNGKDKVGAISIWSENIIAAKKISADTMTDTIWINAFGVLDFGLHSIHKFDRTYYGLTGAKHEMLNLSHEFPKTPTKIAKKYDHFYNGKWQSSVNGRYWTNQNGDSFAEATEKDMQNCANAAREAFKLWRSKKLSQRIKVIRCFAERLRANGELEYAGIVLQLLNRPLDFGNVLSIVGDGEAEILTTPEPVGVVLMPSTDEKMLFTKLIIASVTGNAVTVVLNSKYSVSFASYCDLLGTCGFPPGLISCMFTTNKLLCGNQYVADYFDSILPEHMEDSDSKLPDPYMHRKTEDTSYDNIFIHVTKPKSVWIAIQ